MRTCLVKKLKASVNNPNLPTLEVMQQFTLDAIAASGNSSMTDAQKWALNHFFYSLGKFKNGDDSIWNKLDLIELPIIAGSVGYAAIDYIDNTSRLVTDISNLSIADKGVVLNDNPSITETTFIRKSVTKNININNLSFFTAYSSAEGMNNSIYIAGNNQSNAAVRIMGWSNNYTDMSTNQNFGVSVSLASSSFVVAVQTKPSILRGISLNNFDGSTTNGVTICAESGGTISKRQTMVFSNNYENVSLTNLGMNVRVNQKTTPLHIAIIGEAMDENEVLAVSNAILELRRAFYTQA